jgi:hypothetical protein
MRSDRHWPASARLSGGRKLGKTFAGAGFVISCVLAAAVPVAADTGPAGVEGCVVSAAYATPPIGGLAVHAGFCKYTATRRAGYVATGSRWSVVITRPTGNTTTTITYASWNGAQHVCDAVIQASDEVTVTASGDAVAMAGNPVPAAGDFLPTATGKCVG